MTSFWQLLVCHLCVRLLHQISRSGVLFYCTLGDIPGVSQLEGMCLGKSIDFFVEVSWQIIIFFSTPILRNCKCCQQGIATVRGCLA